jgi:transposase-like protein
LVIAPILPLPPVELAREKAKPISQLARDLGVSDSCLRNWVVKADIEHGRRGCPESRGTWVAAR